MIGHRSGVNDTHLTDVGRLIRDDEVEEMIRVGSCGRMNVLLQSECLEYIFESRVDRTVIPPGRVEIATDQKTVGSGCSDGGNHVLELFEECGERSVRWAIYVDDRDAWLARRQT